ncbi:MAG TPA: SRPBCC domain-containing protein [Terracidiphilus sp.]|nr:SRPBCC domain-containing protein [Terracidiphilus sp.]
MADIRHSIQISAAPEAVYPLAGSANGFTQWWAADVTESGGSVELGFFRRSTIYRLRLTAGAAPNRAEWACNSGVEWDGTRLVFEIAPANSGTVLHFTHAGWESETQYFTSCNTTWGALMFRLKAAAEGKKPGPLFLADGMAY